MEEIASRKFARKIFARGVLAASLAFMAAGAAGMARVKQPCVAEGDIVTGDESAECEFAGIDALFYNRSEKTVTAFTVVCAVVDSNGDSPFTDSPFESVRREIEIPPRETASLVISLDSFLFEMPQDSLEIDFLDVTEIEYDDGTVWRE